MATMTREPTLHPTARAQCHCDTKDGTCVFETLRITGDMFATHSEIPRAIVPLGLRTVLGSPRLVPSLTSPSMAPPAIGDLDQGSLGRVSHVPRKLRREMGVHLWSIGCHSRRVPSIGVGEIVEVMTDIAHMSETIADALQE